MWFENSRGKTAFLLLLETTVQNWKGGKQPELTHHLVCFPFVLANYFMLTREHVSLHFFFLVFFVVCF